MRILAIVVFILGIVLDNFSQDLVAWAPSTNNLTEGESLTHINQGVSATVGIAGDGNDGVSNIQVLIFDDLNVLQDIVIWPTNPDGAVFTGWKVEYVALTGQGSSCLNGGKDWFGIFDDNNNLYSNTEQCVKLAPMPITYQNQPIAKLKYNQSQISWSVATQLNNEKYIIEHSKDGKDFSPIGEIDGDGTNNVEHHYDYTHNNPSIGINYYLIKQIDYDGTSSYSNIASVVFYGDGRDITIYPNPAADEVTVSVTEDTEVSVVDMIGRVLIKQTVNKENNRVDISELSSGIYVFTIGSNNIQRLVKQ